MGLFHNKNDEDAEKILQFFDEHFQEQLRERGREYFEKVIDESGSNFQKQLDLTVSGINADIKEHVTSQLDAAIVRIGQDISSHVSGQLDARLAEHGKAIQTAQDDALRAMSENIETMKRQHQELIADLQKNVADLERNVMAQETGLSTMLEENKKDVSTMKEAQTSALRWLNESAQAMHQQNQQIAEMLQKNVVDQETMIINAFEQNMASVVEHYLMDALGEQYDLKTQLPAIIKQMEQNKQVIMDDMKL